MGHIPRHLFLSYSSQDRAPADRLLAELAQRGFHVWIDRTGLPPGTPNWDRAIRDALQESFGVIFLASPHAVNSNPVHGELAIARGMLLPVVPVLLWGDWLSAAPLDLVNTQYVDLRGTDWQPGLDALGQTLNRIVASRLPDTVVVESLPATGLGPFWQDHLPVQLPDGTVALLKGARRENFDSFLDNFYLSFMKPTVKPFTYGSQWLLTVGCLGINRVVQDWSWLVALAAGRNWKIYDPTWKKRATLGDFLPADNALPFRCRVVMNVESAVVIGVALTADDPYLDRHLELKVEKLIIGILGRHIGMPVRPEEVDPARCIRRYLFLLGERDYDHLYPDCNPPSGQAYVVGRY
jgi:hypothetical protein